MCENLDQKKRNAVCGNIKCTYLCFAFLFGLLTFATACIQESCGFCSDMEEVQTPVKVQLCKCCVTGDNVMMADV